MTGASNSVSSSSGGINASYTIETHFNPKEIEDPSNPYPRPLFLVPLPPLASQLSNDSDDKSSVDVLAYGGDDGAVYLLPSTNNDGATSSSNDANSSSSSSSSSKPRVIKKYDDEVRTIAVSPDGLRIAIGFEDGSTKIYSYDNYVVDINDKDGDGVHHHPFLPRGDVDADAQDDEGGLSQATDGMSQSQGGTRNGAVAVFDGPRMDAAVRQVAFDPRSSSKDKYYLAIASESMTTPLVICNVENESTVPTLYLGEKGEEEHEQGGVRSVAYSTGANGNVLLATLDMRGKLVTWDVSNYDDPELEWDVVHKDYTTYAEVDDGFGNASSKGCRVIWDTASSSNGASAVLFLPGKTDIQYRLCPLAKTLSTSECGEHFRGPPKFVQDGEGRGHKDTIVAMAVQPSTGKGGEGTSESGEGNKWIVTGGRDGKLLLWDLSLRESTGSATEISLQRSPNTIGIPPITSIAWCKMEELYVAFADGTVLAVPVNVEEMKKAGRSRGEKALEEAEEVDQELSDDDDATVELDTQPADEDAAEKESPKKKKKLPANEDSDDYDTSDDDAPPTKKVSFDKDASKRKENASKFIDDEAEAGNDDDDDEAEIQYDDVVPTPDKNANASKDSDEAKDADEANATPFATHDDPDPFADAFESSNDDLLDPDDYNASGYAPAQLPLQQPFAPSSTPLTETRRILCWNHVGIATLRPYEAGSSANLVDVSFHETSGLVGGRRPVTFTDTVGFIVGTVGEEGGLFASDLLEDPDDDQDSDDDDLGNLGLMSDAARQAVKRSKGRKSSKSRGSNIYFQRFETFGRNADKDWSLNLPDGERALGCATGSGWGAVMTSRRFLRLFTLGGIQGPILWLPGEPVTVVGRDRFVAVFYHRSSTPLQDGTQQLAYSVFDGMTGATVANGEVAALSPGASLSWVGFSDKCALSIMDSDGMLSMLARYPTTNSNGTSSALGSNNGNWMPMLDTVGLKKSMSDMYWPVEVHGGKLVCVLLRGGHEHPNAARRPVTTTLRLRMPLTSGLTSAPQLEEGSVRAIFALNQERVLDEYLVSTGDVDEEEMEEEYRQKCNMVDKATLGLFKNVVQNGKVERGYDLVKRLHTENAMEVAMQMADRVGHRKLSDLIDELRLKTYPPIDDSLSEHEDDASFDSGRRSERSGSFSEDDNETNQVIATRQQRLEMSQRISPEGGTSTPQQVRSRNDDVAEDSEGDYPTDESSPPPRESLKRKFKFEQNDSAAPVAKKRINPFAKKLLESPAKGIMKIVSSPKKMSLSRSSTFSKKSRQDQRRGKQIL